MKINKLSRSFPILCAITVFLFNIQANGNSTNVKLTLKSGSTICVVELCSEKILKIDYRPDGEVSPGTPVVDENKKWDPVKATIDQQKEYVEIRTTSMLVKISKALLQVSVYDSMGKLLLSSKEVNPGGGVTFTHAASDNFYGVYTYGSHSNDGTLLRNKNSTIQAFIQGGSGAPFIWSSSGYGVVVNTNGGQISNNEGELSFSNCSRKNTEYYILVGTPKEIISGAGNIAGMPPMFPKWNTGFGQLEWGIDEAELKTHIKNYREKKIPFDWFMLDFDWMAWGEDNFGEVRWGKKFPGGATGELSNWAKDNGLKMIGITKPRIILTNADSTDTQQGKFAKTHHLEYPELNIDIDYFVRRPCRTLDFRIPECREWWAGHLMNGGFKKGMFGFLNDEADIRNPGKFGLGNLNNHYMQRAIYEEQRKISNERVFSINRTAYMGSQKYAYGLWSGDNYPTFTDLKAQCLKLIAANNALIPVWGFCSSAFGNKPKLSNELYVRSLQLAAFSPLFFLHGMLNEQKQPWFFGEKVESLAREIVNMRYRLIPYAYSFDRVKHENMIGISRSLVIEYPNDQEVRDITNEFMYGDYLLISPVLDSAVVSQKIYLPEGKWIDYTYGKTYEGKQYIDYAIDKTSWKDIPIFIKDGAIIPTQEIMKYVGERETKMIYLDMFPTEKTTNFPLYDDDGHTYNYEKGQYFLQNISLSKVKDRIKIEFSKQEKNYAPTFLYFLAKVHGGEAKEVVAGKTILKKFDSYNDLLEGGSEGFCIVEDTYGTATYIRLKVKGEGQSVTVKL